MYIFYAEVALADGFDALLLSRNNRQICGLTFSAPSGAALWKKCWENGESLKCWECGVEADRFILKHHPNDMKKPPVLELYAHDGKTLLMMTRDHIIPKSVGGLDLVENLRPGCERCNGRRKNIMTPDELEFMWANTHLWKEKL